MNSTRKTAIIAVSIALCVFFSAACDAPETASRKDNSPVLSAPYAPDGVLAKSLPEIVALLQAGETSSEEIVSAYLDRIERIDRSGPRLQSVIAINPDSLARARELDAQRRNAEILGPLHGVPVLVKDNIETRDNMPTTAGSFALEENFTNRDSPLVAELREAGAVILGKANLSEWMNFRSLHSNSGWSAIGGQVRNPHMLDRNPCGSSSGSAVAIAASLAAGAVGTETSGSIMCPASVNGIVGFKPSVGLVSQEFIIPVSSSQDTAGPMSKTVEGAAMMLAAMATGETDSDFAGALRNDSLAGARVGVLRFVQGGNAAIIDLFDQAISDMESVGAILVEIEALAPEMEAVWLSSHRATENFTVLKYEFKDGLNNYLPNAAAKVRIRTLEDLIAFNIANSDIELALFDQNILLAAQEMGSLDDSAYIAVRDRVQSTAREQGIDALMTKYDLDVLVAPTAPISPPVDQVNGDIWPSGRLGATGIAAVAGYPHLTVPMGSVHGLPVGVSFIGRRNTDAQVLSYGYAYEQHSQRRVEPKYLENALARSEIHSAAFVKGK